ncbi:ELWxxDGT repeat protein [Dyadobacter sediminis]|uniref:DNRLRE domain-containing protein n=1 Tax=Dyadobacter sediminis TaxID=1493691 RepID=A0A5R9KE29_9BACT|nr:ELWxxDGT repeat protein [Dyadobacter sediminis]TLU94301.1 DNRLRE domain-containing protein [Dyadobacter sediminis]GGB92471.1 hypothetical protein GCM10011325_19890 [Dyadobacter sediminis]
MKKLLPFLALLLISIQPLLAQEGSLVKDINVSRTEKGFKIQASVKLGDLIYMIADDGFQKNGLWKSDGTAEGTEFVMKMPEGSYVNGLSTLNGRLLFVVHSYELGNALYSSDATPEGTKYITELDPDFLGTGIPFYTTEDGSIYFYSYFEGLLKINGNSRTVIKKGSYMDPIRIPEIVDVNGTLFFIVVDNSGVNYLYQSDGTPAGTMAVANTIGTGSFSSLEAVGNEVFFKGSAGQDIGLYKASNTAAITLVKTFASGVENLTAAGSTLYFSANDGISGNELWKSNGSAAGTVLVENINPGAASSDPSLFTVINGQLYFTANNGASGQELWISSGSASSTELVKDIRPGSAGSGISQLKAVGSKAAFMANDGSGDKLWQSNGTVYGTKVLADARATQLLDANGTLYFNGNPGSGLELYKSTMVTGGTVALTDIARPESTPRNFTQANDVSYFSADDGIHGRELWKTDGSNVGTVLVSDVLTGANSSNPEQITHVNGAVYFVTGNGSQVHSLWKSSGTSATTIKLKDFTKADTLQGLINVNGTLFFGIVNGSGSMQLWKSNGTAAGTELIRTFVRTPTFSPVTLNGEVFFGAWDGVNSVELWKSNGTAAGTVIVRQLVQRRGQYLYKSITVANNQVYFVINDVNNHHLLVKTDGTSAGTTVIKDIYTDDPDATFSELTTVNNLVYFSAVTFYIINQNGYDRKLNREFLWRTDGTEQGTITLTYCNGYVPEVGTRNFTAAGDLLYFIPPCSGEKLWRSDGSEEGTFQLKDIQDRNEGTYLGNTTAVGSTLYFTVSDGTHGVELWKSRGTAESTVLAYDMTPGGSTKFYELAALNNQLLISADNGMYGAELFKYQEVLPSATLRINAGGEAFAASGERQFSKDQYYAGTDRTTLIATGDILNTTDDVLYRSGRCSPSFSYNIPVPNGKVTVILHFAEIWYGVPGKGAGGAGKRQFHVDMEGRRKLTNFDIFVAAGGAMRAVQKSFPVAVTDGMLNIDFLSGAADLPRISAIEVVVGSLALSPVADAFVRDSTFKNMNFGFSPDLEIKRVPGSDLSPNRSSYLRFQLPQEKIATAKLRIYGHNHENSNTIYLHAYGVDEGSWKEDGITSNNAPAASTPSLGLAGVNDVYQYYEVDVTGYVKAQHEMNEGFVSLFLNDPNNRNTRLVFNSKENAFNRPELIIQLAPESNKNTRLSQEGSKETAQTDLESYVYPNPVKDHFTVSVSRQHAGPVSFELISESGKGYAITGTENVRPGEKAAVSISGLSLSSGIHLLKIKSDEFTEVIKMLVTE